MTPIAQQVKTSLEEDIGSGDISAELIASNLTAHAEIVTRERAVVCGIAWVNEVFKQVDATVSLDWQVQEGDAISPSQVLVAIQGSARSLLTAERTALNWLQTLSGTATRVSQFVKELQTTETQLLDTRKTIPGLRQAQKYAVTVGGGVNHRMGLYDAYLIKENHILSCGSIRNAIFMARRAHPEKIIEVEVENLTELEEALSAKAEIIMLDNFNLNTIRQAVLINKKRAKLEVSGNVKLENIREIAQTGVDYISVGSLTKHLEAIDLSMRIVTTQQ